MRVPEEVYHTIYYIAESPHSKNVIYAGADDGLVHITTDGGKSWKNISPELEEGMINSIDVSPHDPATVYIAYNRYKFDDFKPLTYLNLQTTETHGKCLGLELKKIVL